MAEEKWIPGKFESEERICIEKFIKFSKFPIMKEYFAITAETEYGTYCDTVNKNQTGGTVVVELKDRKCGAYKDCFIETKKYEKLMELYEKGCLPLYLNFIGDKYYLWVLPSIPKSRIALHKKMPIKSSISGKKYVDRYGLKWQDAWIFDDNGKILQKSACNIIPNPPIQHKIDFTKKINNAVLNKLK